MLKLLNIPLVNWNYATEPEAASGGRSIHWPRGSVLGGSGSINGMLYVRGNPADYDGWAQMGCRGWSFDDVLPYFRQSEHYEPGGDARNSRQGRRRCTSTITDNSSADASFRRSARRRLVTYSAKDLNGRDAGRRRLFADDTRNGRFRGSTARTFLAAAKGRPNLRIETDAIATRLLFDGRRCSGVAFHQRGQDSEIRAAREVILCGGAMNSPHLLQISGVGPAAHLQSIGVAVLHDLPGVGANLQDHYIARIQHRVRDEITIERARAGPARGSARSCATSCKGAAR